MLTVGLTGGIGAGKSTVADLLVGHGAKLVDADLVAREVVAPGGPAYQPLIDRFGPEIVDPGGLIDRPTLAELVFGHPDALADLNAITHPAIGVEMIARKDRFAGTDEIVVMDIPLLKASPPRDCWRWPRSSWSTPRPSWPSSAWSPCGGWPRTTPRPGSAPRSTARTRLEGADLVIDNSGDHDHLAAEVDRVWAALVGLRDRSDRPGRPGPPPTA